MNITRPSALPRLWSLVLVLLGTVGIGRAQWATESYSVKAGWNAIWVPLDCTDRPIDAVVAEPAIEEIWRWNPAPSTTQFVIDPQTPVAGDVQWDVWRRTGVSTFNALTGNSAYLVKVADAVGTDMVTVAIKGRPVAPRYPWKESGLNLFGFSTVAPGGPDFEAFFSHSSSLNNNPAIFAYRGGAGLAAAPTRVTAPRLEFVTRGQAFWVQSTNYTDYYGPLKLTVTGSTFDFGTERYTASMRIKNVTAATVTARIDSQPSDTPPSGQPAVSGTVPLQVRGQFNPVTSQYAYSALPFTLALGAGEEKEVVFTLSRRSMTAPAGSVYQSLLRVTDSLGLTRIDLPASAVTTSLAGVWLGSAMLATVDRVNGTAHTEETTGAANQFPLRFIVHLSSAGQATLLQQIYVGEGQTAGTRVAATGQSALGSASIGSASRLSSSTLPPTLGTSQFRIAGTGTLGLSGAATFSFTLAAGDSTNPFLHAYHPDHRPDRSYAITRAIRLDFDSLLAATDPTLGSSTLGGIYSEQISGLRSGAPIQVKGRFVLHRVADIPTLTIAQ